MFVFCSRGIGVVAGPKRFVARGLRSEASTTCTLRRYLYAPMRTMFVDHIVNSAYVEFVPLGGFCAICGAIVSCGVVGQQLAGSSGVCGGGGKTVGNGSPGAGSAVGQ